MPGAKFALKDDVRSRCKVLQLDEKSRRRFTPVSLELFGYLSEVKSIDFSLYFRVENEMVEFVRPKDLSDQLLNAMWKATLIDDADVEICLLKADYPKFENVINTVREGKLKKVLEQDPTLDPRVLDVYGSLSGASQMVLRGGIDATVADRATAAAAHLMRSQLNNHIAVGTISRMIQCDSTLYDHSASVAMFSGIIAGAVGKNLSQREREVVTQCGLYHDTGKSCVPGHILNKPGKFTPEEFEVMKTHASHGHAELMKAIDKGAPIDPVAARVALEHHERFNGGGYPHGRKGRLEDDGDNGIHLYARIVTIADVYSALLMRRVYKEPMSSAQALEVMSACAEREYDPEIFSVFHQHIEETLRVFRNRERDLKRKSRIRMIDDRDSFAKALKDRANDDDGLKKKLK